jgi:hypothetical protein
MLHPACLVEEKAFASVWWGVRLILDSRRLTVLLHPMK